MVYAVWIDADGGAYAELQSIVETLRLAARERKDLHAMDCGKVVVTEHTNEGEVYALADRLCAKPVKVMTAYGKLLPKG